MEIGNNRAAVLYAHVMALERLEEAKKEAAADYNERKTLAKEDGFDVNVLAAILKRRKNGDGQTMEFDRLLREYEDALLEQKELPLAERVTNAMRASGLDVSVTIRNPPEQDDRDDD